MRILLIEDDKLLAVGLQEGLEQYGYRVDHLAAAEPAEAILRRSGYEAAIVDIGLPKIDGLELVRRWRRQGLATPVLILTARDSLEDRVTGLDLGADDYLIKPCQLPELAARLRALIRRSRFAASSELIIGALRLDLSTRTVTINGQPLDLTSREYEILEQLALASPRVVGKQKLTESLGRYNRELTLNAVEVYVSRLRNKLSAKGVEIRTLRGVGYRLDAMTEDEL